MIPVLVCNVIAMLCSAVLMPVNEEMTRKQLIKYLQNHEKAMSVYKNNNLENNQNNEIVLVGEPFNNRKLFELYNKTIKDLTNDGK